MDPAKLRNWERCFEEVVCRPADWPRELWFAAVEDGLAAALPPGSRLLSEYRRDVAELAARERASRGSYEDEQRIAQIEAQIQQLIGLADETIRRQARVAGGSGPATASSGDTQAPASSDDDRAPGEDTAPAAAESRWGWGPMVGSAALAVVLFGASLVAAMHIYESRLAAQVRAEAERHLGRLEQTVATIEQDLAARAAALERQSEEVEAVRAELADQVAAFSARAGKALDTMATLREAAVAELERRLARESDEVTALLGRLGERGRALDRALDEVSRDLAGLERRLPELGLALTGLDTQIEQGRAAFAETSEEIATLKTMTPEMIAWVEGEREALETTVAERRTALADLGAAIDDLRSRVGAFEGEIEGFHQVVDEELAAVRREGERLASELGEVRARGDLVTELVAGAEADVDGMKRRLEKEVDVALGELAEKADLAVMRGDDVLERAGAEAARRLDAAAEAAVEELGAKAERQLADLERRIAATRTELEATRTGLISSWQQMDRAVAGRQERMLADMDRYAQAMEQRVKELVDALNVMVAQSSEQGG